MALIECKECKKQISNKAKTCPHCGAKVKKTHPITILLAIVFAFLLAPLLFRVHREFAETRDCINETLGKGKYEKAEIERKVLYWLNEKEEIQQMSIQCISVGLVAESSHKYTGLAKFDNGEKTDVEVTIDDDAYLFSAKFPCGIPKKKTPNDYTSQPVITGSNSLMIPNH